MNLFLENLAVDFRNPALAENLIEKIRQAAPDHPVRFMEVCGTHTQAIFRYGIRGLLPRNIRLISGPGCPVCVTDQSDIDYALALAREPGVILATFGDMLRVPGSLTTLEKEKNEGAAVKIVYSPHECLKIAQNNPNKKVVFLGIGFDTTTPTVAATILQAEALGLNNFFVFARHKLIPPALQLLASHPDLNLSGFICPGHVSVVIGADAYREVTAAFRIPSVVCGFEPLDIRTTILMLLNQVRDKTARVENQYRRVVTASGNVTAQKIVRRVFTARDAVWRGLGNIPESGLVINQRYQRFDAEANFDIHIESQGELRGCRCGEVLLGKIAPPQCELFGETCSPLNPVGACMVSTEGTCAAYYKYERRPSP